MKTHARGFTLIELLIVVAIIAILAAIAVPNFLEAQIRSKVSRVKADQRTYATAIESYFVDWNRNPCPLTFGDLCPLEEMMNPLSTPVAYLGNAHIPEPFNSRQGWILFQGWDVLDNGGPPPDKAIRQPLYLYVGLDNDDYVHNSLPAFQAVLQGVGVNASMEQLQQFARRRWFVVSPGPDTLFGFDRCLVDNPDVTRCLFQSIAEFSMDDFEGVYDPTNGTVSQGEVVRTGEGVSGSK